MAASQDCQVLVVDDDQAIREMVSAILEDEGYSVRTAADGLEALAAIDAIRDQDPECPRVMLLDMRMPELDGWGVARRLQERGLRIPIVVMTAARDARQWAGEIGADAYLAKPFQLDDLIEAVTQLTGPPR
jgi:two-component system response regulator MprA